MNEGTAAVAELAANNSAVQSARTPEQESVEQFDNILATDKAVQTVKFEDAALNIQSNDEANQSVVENARLGAIDRVADTNGVAPFVPQSAQFAQYNYQLTPGSANNPIVESLASTIDGIDKRQQSVMEKINTDWSTMKAEMTSEGKQGFENELEMVWKMQKTTMEVQAWSVEVNLMTGSVSKSLTGVQTLFKSGG